VVPPVAYMVDGEPVLFRPTVTLVGSGGTDRRMQVIFEDVTAETRRHDLIEAYANQVVLGQEEERRHLAQELHDGPLQTLIHLCRQIDALDTDSGSGSSESAPSPLAMMRTTVEDTVAEVLALAALFLSSVNLSDLAGLKDGVRQGGGLSGLSQKLKEAAANSPDLQYAVRRETTTRTHSRTSS